MDQSKTKVFPNREVKSDAFTTHFSNPKNAAQLYYALEGVKVAPEDIRITTLDGILFVARKNDLSFTTRGKVLVISEHQSTINKNMPLRSAIYYGRVMEKLIAPKQLYQRKQILIPTPTFYVFYNGNAHQPPETVMKLSDSYLEKTPEPMLELTVRVININLPENHEILQHCRPLYEYSWFIQKIKDYRDSGMLLDGAITQAIRDCDQEGILAEFMQEHRSEVINMLFKQFDMDEAIAYTYQEGREDGLAEGELCQLIKIVARQASKGKSPAEIAEILEEDANMIERICHALQQCGPEAEVKTIYDIIKND